MIIYVDKLRSLIYEISKLKKRRGMNIKSRVFYINYLKNVFLAKSDLIWKLFGIKHLFAKSTEKLTIVTASDSSHFKSLLNLLSSVSNFEPGIIVKIWDLGLNQKELDEIRRRFSSYQIFRFSFENYPQHFRNKSNYAWKPALIWQEFSTNDGLILYLDAGNLITDELFWLRKFISSKGFFSAYSSGQVSDWTHPSMLAYFEIPKRIYVKPNLNAAILGFDTQNVKTRQLLMEWNRCAMTHLCIAPEGSTRENHRFDQAALTCIAYLKKFAPRGIHPANLDKLALKIHQDVD